MRGWRPKSKNPIRWNNTHEGCSSRCSLTKVKSQSVWRQSLFFAISPVMFGHHGVSDYDMANVVTWHVTVTGFVFVNPHALLDFTRKNEQGKNEEWQGELQSYF